MQLLNMRAFLKPLVNCIFHNQQYDILILHYPIFDTEQSNIYEEKLFICETCFFGIKKYYDLFNISKEKNIIFDYPLKKDLQQVMH